MREWSIGRAPAFQAGRRKSHASSILVSRSRFKNMVSLEDPGSGSAQTHYIERGVEFPHEHAGVAQLVEHLLPKQNVVGSNPITRSRQVQAR